MEKNVQEIKEYSKEGMKVKATGNKVGLGLKQRGREEQSPK